MEYKRINVQLHQNWILLLDQHFGELGLLDFGGHRCERGSISFCLCQPNSRTWVSSGCILYVFSCFINFTVANNERLGLLPWFTRRVSSGYNIFISRSIALDKYNFAKSRVVFHMKWRFRCCHLWGRLWYFHNHLLHQFFFSPDHQHFFFVSIGNSNQRPALLPEFRVISSKIARKNLEITRIYPKFG